MDFITREDSMISIEMPSDSTRETSREYHWSLSMPESDIREPLFERHKGSTPPPPPMDMNNISGFEKLMDIEGVLIEKNYTWGKVPCCWKKCSSSVKKYSYSISDLAAIGTDKKGKNGPTILRGIENIPDFDHVWCTPGQRAFGIEVRHQEFDWRQPNASAFLKLERKSTCSFLWMSRPEMIVTLVEGGQNERLGRIVNPIQCGVDFRVKIYDASEALRYIIKASCFSCGVTCPGSCSSETIMEVCDGFGNVVSKLTILEGKKVPKGMSHIFAMDFPETANGYDKALLVAAIMMIGKTFFEPNDFFTNACEGFETCKE